VAEQLELLADLLEIEGQPAFRVLAYRRAATRIREQGTPVAQLALDGKAKELQGIGATIQDKIVQIVDTGEIEALTKRRKTIPPEVVEFLNIPGLGPKTVRKIWQELGVTTLAELKDAARSQRLRTLPGLGAKLEGRRELGRGLAHEQAGSLFDLLEGELHFALIVPVEHQPLPGLRHEDLRAALFAVVPAEDAVAAFTWIELDVVREPLLQLLGLGEGSPHLSR
jgi:hypothetical protein